jgi:hypothetical protein
LLVMMMDMPLSPVLNTVTSSASRCCATSLTTMSTSATAARYGPGGAGGRCPTKARFAHAVAMATRCSLWSSCTRRGPGPVATRATTREPRARRRRADWIGAPGREGHAGPRRWMIL